MKGVPKYDAFPVNKVIATKAKGVGQVVSGNPSK